MRPEEAFNFKRNNFMVKALKYFNFLVSEFGYSEPTHKFWQQENGSITRDQFKYENLVANRGISIVNAYHPADYGFEIIFYKPNNNTPRQTEEMVYYILKEDQDIEQSYLEQAAKTLKNDFVGIIQGQEWIKNKRNSS